MKRLFKINFTRFIILLFTVSNSCFVYSQTTSFLHYGIENGLPQSQVKTIEQDNDGNLWIGTMAGVCRYNGKTFTNFTKKNGLAEDWVTASCKDKHGNIWLGHWGGGVSLYNYKTKNFQKIDFTPHSEFKTISAIAEDVAGNIWFSTMGAGVLKLDISKNKISSISEKNGLSSNQVSSIAFDASGNLWIGSQKGVSVLNTKAGNISSQAFTYYSSQNGLVNDNVTALAFVLNGEIWLGLGDAGIQIIKINRETSFKFLPSSLSDQSIILGAKEGIPQALIQNIIEDRNRNIWICTQGGGIARFNPLELNSFQQGSARGSIKVYSTKQGLDYQNSNTALEDREGNIWIGTDLGLNMFSGERFQTFDEADGITNNIVWSVLNDKDGNLWLGTNNGISKLTFAREGLSNLENIAGAPGLFSNVILSTFQDSKGNIWFGTSEGGVSCLEAGSSGFKNYSASQGLADNSVYDIAEDKEGNIWFATESGASRLDLLTKEFRTYTSRDGLGGNYVYRVFKDSKGKLWFGVLGGNLTVFDGRNFRQYNESNGLNNKFILCMTEDAERKLWFGTYGGGLFRLDGEKFTNLSSADGLRTETPYSIIADEENNLWIGSGRGIEKYNQKQKLFKYYGKQEGFLGVETNANAISRDKDGNIWFGTIMGVVKFNPQLDKINVAEPLTTISGLQLFYKDTVFPADNTFSYDQNHLTFLFNAVSLSNPGNVKYQYKLEGFDKDWSPASSLNEAVYANLSPGEYAFQLRSCNSDGLWTKAAVAYTFKVAPPFWQTLWFKALSIVLIVLTLSLILKARTRKLMLAKRELEMKVQDRTRELADKNKELARKNKDITDSINYAKRIQEAILPDTTRISQVFPNSFIYYQPKDIVSGDFYFFAEKNNKVLIGSIDCTGHGVPGALMSMIGANFLNHIVNELEITEPGKILMELHKKVYETLHKNTSKESTDGMDMGLISLDTTNNNLEFAGAVRPLYMVNNSGLRVIKGSKSSIGGVATMQDKLFESQHLPLTQNDSFYLFTDGVVDQFGGEKGKKFMVQRWKDLLYEIKHLSMQDQKETIEQTLNNWRGEHEQVDDILVIGVRVN